MNFRIKFIRDMVAYCKENIDQLTDWEQVFVKSMGTETNLTSGQYNKLEQIYQDLRKKG